MKKGNDQKQNAEKRKNRMTALLMALILCVGMVSGTNKEVRAQSASQNSETQTASESDVTTENTANIAENTTKSAATVTHYEYTTEEVKETIQGIFEWAKSLTNADELIDKTFLEGADTSLNDWFAFAAARSGYKEDYKSYRKAMETAIAKKRTSGFAIIAMIQPITKGIKYEITDGTTSTTNSKITTAVIRFNTAFTYFLDCLHML